jgi:hypothetical protein
LQTVDNYGENEVDFDINQEPENQYQKLRFYLGYGSRENALCCPKHAPLEKVKRSSKVMIIFVVFNSINMVIGGFFLWFEIEVIQAEQIQQEAAWVALLEGMRLNFLIMLALYLCAFCRNPGYSKSI